MTIIHWQTILPENLFRDVEVLFNNIAMCLRREAQCIEKNLSAHFVFFVLFGYIWAFSHESLAFCRRSLRRLSLTVSTLPENQFWQSLVGQIGHVEVKQPWYNFRQLRRHPRNQISRRLLCFSRRSADDFLSALH